MKAWMKRRLYPGSVRHGTALVAILLAISAATFFGGPSIASLLASATSSIVASDAILYFTPYDQSAHMETGIPSKVDVDINAGVPINAAGMSIIYPVGKMEVVGISKARSFMDLWTEETVIDEKNGSIHFSGGTTKKGGIAGTSTVLTLEIRGKTPGLAELQFEDIEVYPSDGRGKPVSSTARSYRVTFVQKEISPAAPGAAATSVPPGPATASADFDDNGRVTILDATILVLRFIKPYDPLFDLTRDGRIDWSDMWSLFGDMK